MNTCPVTSAEKTTGRPASCRSSRFARATGTAACGVGFTLVAWVALVMLLDRPFRQYDQFVWSGSLWFSALVCTGCVAYSRYSVDSVLACTIAFGVFGWAYLACEGPIFGAVADGGDPWITQFVVWNLACLPLGVFGATEIGRWLGQPTVRNKNDGSENQGNGPAMPVVVLACFSISSVNHG